MSDKQGGFTIIELMIATTVFAVMMSIATAVAIGMTTHFRKGIVESSTQNVARSVLDTIAQAIEFSSQEPSPLAGSNNLNGKICIGSTLYEYNVGQLLSDQNTNTALVEHLGTGNGCTAYPGSSYHEMLSSNMRLAFLKVEPGGGPDVFKVTVRVAYGDDDLLCSSNVGGSCDKNAPTFSFVAHPNDADLLGVQCKSGIGSQFCAVRELSTTVKSRLY